MTKQRKSIPLILFFLTFFIIINANAQNWQNLGFSPSHPIAYDQNGQNRTIITLHNVYRSTDGGSTWQQKLSPDNAPFLQSEFLSLPSGDVGKFQYFFPERSVAFDEVLFLTAHLGLGYTNSARNWKIYHSIDGGTTLTEIFSEEDAYGSSTNLGYDNDIFQVNENTYIIQFTSNAPGPNFSKLSYYVSFDKGQSWDFFYQHNDRNMEFVGEQGDDFVFLLADELIYRNKTTANISQTLSLPEDSKVVTIENNTIRVLAWDLDGNELRGYTSTNNGLNFTSFATTISLIEEAQIFGDQIFVSAGGFSYQTKTFRLSFQDFNSPIQVSEAPHYSNYFPYRLTSDGQMVNREPGAAPHVPNIFANEDGKFFNMPFVISNDNWSTFHPADKPPFSLEALNQLDEKWLLFAGNYAWHTTDGVDFEQSFSLSNFPSEIRHFQTASTANSYSDPQTTHYITNDAMAVASNEPNIIGLDDKLLSRRNTGIFQSTDGGTMWTPLNDGYFWTTEIYGDDITGHLYALEINADNSTDLYHFRVSKSTDEGQSWHLLPEANFPAIPSRIFYYDNQFSPLIFYNNYIIIKSDTAIWYSTDGGLTFQTINNLPFVAAGAKMYQLGGDVCIRTAGEEFYKLNINDWLGVAGGGTLEGAQVDLSMSVDMNPPNPALWTNFDVTYTITNSGMIPATGLNWEYFIASFNDAAQQGGTMADIVNLEQDPGFGYQLGAGETGSITYHYFRKDGELPNPWGQISSYREPDTDSRPNNGDYPSVNEDDETIFVGGTPNICAFNDVVIASNCILGEPDDDDRVTLEIQPFGENLGSAYRVSGPEIFTATYPYGESIVLSSYPSEIDIVYHYTITDVDHPECTINFIFNPSLAGVDCEPEEELTNLAPDTFSGLEVIARVGDSRDIPFHLINQTAVDAPSNLMVAYLSTDNQLSNNDIPIGEKRAEPLESTSIRNEDIFISIPDITVPGDYYVIIKVDVLDEIEETSEDNTTFYPIEIRPAIADTGMDLELLLSVDNSNPNIYTHINFTLNLNNTGDTDATGIVIDFPFPDGLVHSSNTPIQGSFNLFNQTWEVGDLAAGQSTSLDLRLFLLSANEVAVFTQIQSAHPNDTDSTPNNGNCCTPNEDDEAVVIISPILLTEETTIENESHQLQVLSNTDLTVLNLYPNVATDEIRLLVATKLLNLNLQVYDLNGIAVLQKRFEDTAGTNALVLDISALAKGIYFVRFEGGLEQEVLRFVKL